MRLDLAAEWRSRRWRRLLNVIDQLPRDSRYVEAMAMDEQLAERLADRPQPQAKAKRRMADWSVQVELLTAILARLGEVTQAIAALGGAKPRKLPPVPVPQTAMDRIRNRKRFEKHHALVARVMRRPADPPAE
jgi:hypothetical protein